MVVVFIVHISYHDSFFYLPVSVNDSSLLVTDVLVVPQPGLGVDGLTHGTENLERGQIILFGEGFPELHQGSNGGRGRVKLANFVLLNDLPESVVGWVKRGALEDD